MTERLAHACGLLKPYNGKALISRRSAPSNVGSECVAVWEDGQTCFCFAAQYPYFRKNRMIRVVYTPDQNEANLGDSIYLMSAIVTTHAFRVLLPTAFCFPQPSASHSHKVMLEFISLQS